MTGKEFANKYQSLHRDLNALRVQQLDAKRLNEFHRFRNQDEQAKLDAEYQKCEQSILNEIKVMELIVDELPPMEKNIFYLRYRDHETLNQISENLGYHISTIKKHHVLLLKKMNSEISEKWILKK